MRVLIRQYIPLQARQPLGGGIPEHCNPRRWERLALTTANPANLTCGLTRPRRNARVANTYGTWNESDRRTRVTANAAALRGKTCQARLAIAKRATPPARADARNSSGKALTVTITEAIAEAKATGILRFAPSPN